MICGSTDSSHRYSTFAENLPAGSRLLNIQAGECLQQAPARATSLARVAPAVEGVGRERFTNE
jgi:hypothetical protein